MLKKWIIYAPKWWFKGQAWFYRQAYLPLTHNIPNLRILVHSEIEISLCDK